MTQKKTLTDTRFAALATIDRKGGVEWPQIDLYEDNDGVVTRTYADLVRLGLAENHAGYSYRLTPAGKAAHDAEYLRRFQRHQNDVFVLTEDYGPMCYATAYETFGKLKAAAESAIRKAADEYFSSPSLFPADHEDRAAVTRKAEAVLAKAKRAVTVEALEKVAEAVFKKDPDGWHYGAKILIDRTPFVRG